MAESATGSASPLGERRPTDRGQADALPASLVPLPPPLPLHERAPPQQWAGHQEQEEQEEQEEQQEEEEAGHTVWWAPWRHWTVPSLETVRDLVGFFICGLLNNFGYVVFLSAAESIVQGSSGVVLLANILPTLATKLTAPFFMHYIPYRLRVVVLVAAALGSFQLVAWGKYVWAKLLGVVLASFSAGGGEITFLALASYYPKNTLSAWSSGTGGAGIAGSLAYLALSEWIGLSNRNSLLVVGPLPLLILVSFFLILTGKERRPRIAIEVPEEDPMKPGPQSLKMEIPGSQDEEVTEEVQPPDRTEETVELLKAAPPPSRFRFLRQLLLLRPLLKYMIPLFLVYYSEYVINQGIFPTIVFSGWDSKKAYKYYQLMYQIGVFISRSSVNICPIPWLWVPAVLQAGNLVFLFLQSYYNFIPSIFIIFPIIVWEGLLGGATYVNSMVLIYKTISETNREFSLGVVSVADDIGISLAALTAIFLERFLRKHNNIS